MGDGDERPKLERHNRPTIRTYVEAGALIVVLLGIGGWLLSRRTQPYPYRDGGSYQATADCTQQAQAAGGCFIRLGPLNPTGPQWTGETNSLPPAWEGQLVPGTLHIISNWGSPSATFEANGTTVTVWGGKPDGHHGFGV